MLQTANASIIHHLGYAVIVAHLQLLVEEKGGEKKPFRIYTEMSVLL